MQWVISFFESLLNGTKAYMVGVAVALTAMLGLAWYVGHLKDQAQAKTVELENAKTQVVIEKDKAEVKAFEERQKAIFEDVLEEEITDDNEDVDDSVGYHTIVFD